jgi:hypothetical protein
LILPLLIKLEKILIKKSLILKVKHRENPSHNTKLKTAAVRRNKK